MKTSDIWRDPVVSAVVASGITSLAGSFIVGKDTESDLFSLVRNLLTGTDIPNWQFILSASIGIGLAVFSLQKWRESRDRSCISSKEWFALINQKLNDCNSACVYLRKFDHPDNFRDEHKIVLMEMMRAIKARVAAGANIRIISYNDNGDKTGLEWLRAELNESPLVSNHIKIVSTQVSTNSSSMYIFDDKKIVFSKRDGKLTRYYCESHAESIIFEFVKDGFEEYWRRV